MPNFEIPDEWLSEAGVQSLSSVAEAYASDREAELIDLREILPPPRNKTSPKDWKGFDRARMISVLRGIVAGVEIEPVPVRAIPEEEFAPQPYRFRVLNGFHRYHASIIAGFRCLPAVHR